MAWTERLLTFDTGQTGIETWDSFSVPGALTYSAVLSWLGGSPAVNMGAINAFPCTLRPQLVQVAGSSLTSASFSTYNQNLTKATSIGNYVIVDVLFNPNTIVSGIRVGDDGGNFYWPLYCFRSAGGAIHFACFIGLQIAPASQINVTQGPGAGSTLGGISLIAQEYSGIAMTQPGSGSFSGSSDGVHSTLTGSGYAPWMDSCYVDVAGVGTITVGYVSATELTTSTLLGSGPHTFTFLDPPDNMGGYSTPSAAVIVTEQGESLSTLGISNTVGTGSYLLHLVGGSYGFFPVSPPSGGGTLGCSASWLQINEPFGDTGVNYPVFSPRVAVHDFDGVWTYDALSGGGPQAFGASLAWASGSQDTLSSMIALRPAGTGAIDYVQGAGAASASGVDVDTFTIAFVADNTAGNCIVVDVFMLNVNDDTFSVSDSNGNTYVKVFEKFTGTFFGGDVWATFVAFNVNAGANTITVNAIPPVNPTDIEDWAVAIHEYSGVATAFAVDTYATAQTLSSASPASVSLALSSSEANELLHVAIFAHQYNATVTTLTSAPANEWIDQSIRLSMAETISFSQIVKQRGSAKIPLYIPSGDSYMPTVGSQVCLWDLADEADYEVFSGTIDDYEVKWLGIRGDKIVTLTCVSLEQCFDTIRLPSLLFTNTTAGAIFTALLVYAPGVPVGIGTIEDGASIDNFLIADYPSIADMFTQLATLSEYVWGVDTGTGNLYFTPPDLTPSPFVVDAEDVLWEQMTLKAERHDYRNRQILKPNSNAAVLSSEYFVGIGQLDFTLLRPVDQVTNAWVTQNIQNSATGTFSGQPNPGDTVTIGFGPHEVWQANFAYSVGTQILDPGGFVQVVTAATGNSGSTQPSWIDIYGETTTDHDVLWKNQGPLGFGGNVAIYTFVTALDNTQFGQVLIGATVAATAQNLADAINAIAAQSGSTFSLPTWENPQLNADEPAGSSTIVVRNKAAGAGFVSALSATGTAFSFNAAATFGGVTTFGTITVNVGVQGQTIGGSGPTLVYTPGSSAISLATPLNSGSNLQVEYKAANAGYIIVENTADVIARAIIEGGTGKYQQSSSDDTAVTLFEGLQLAQQQLAAYGVIPQTFEFTTFQAGLYTGQVLDIVLGGAIGDLVDTTLSPLTGQWFIQEINAEAVPLYREEGSEPVYLPGPTGGHYRYTVKCIDVTQIGDWIDFWEGLSGGGGSGAGTALFPGGGSLGPPSGSGSSYSAVFTAVAGTPLTITHGLNTTTIIAQAFDGSGNLMSFGAMTVVDANNISVTFGIGFTGKIVILGA